MCQRVEWYFSKVVRESLTEKAASEQRLKGERSSAGIWRKSITSRGKSKGKAWSWNIPIVHEEQKGRQQRESS